MDRIRDRLYRPSLCLKFKQFLFRKTYENADKKTKHLIRVQVAI